MAFFLETARLNLRELTETDAEHLFRIYQDPEVMRFMGPPPERLAEEREKIRQHRERYYEKIGFGLWAVVLRKDNRFIGRCGLLRSGVEGGMETEIAYLLDQPYWNQGYATEAAQAILKAGEEQFGLKRIVAFIHPQNTPSIRVAERIGLCYEREVEYKHFGTVSLYVARFELSH